MKYWRQVMFEGGCAGAIAGLLYSITIFMGFFKPYFFPHYYSLSALPGGFLLGAIIILPIAWIMKRKEDI